MDTQILSVTTCFPLDRVLRCMPWFGRSLNFGRFRRKVADRIPYIEVPRESAVLVVAAQPNCPLEFENPMLLMGIEGRRLALKGSVRNRATKPISSFSFALWNSVGGGWVDSWPRKITTEVVAPGQSLSLATEPVDDVVSLTPELRQKLKLDGPMKGVLLAMIVEVKFVDGTSYSDESIFKALRDYLDNVQAK
jgi:hypothetical protein